MTNEEPPVGHGTKWPKPIEVLMPRSGLKRVFYTVGEVEDWLKNESTFWDTMFLDRPTKLVMQNTPELHKKARSNLDIFAGFIGNGPGDLFQLSGFYEATLEHFDQLVNANYIDASSKIGEELSDAIGKPRDRAIPYALASLLEVPILDRNTMDHRAAMDGFAWARELENSVTKIDSSEDALGDTVNKWNTELSEIHDAYSNASVLLANATETTTTIQTEQTTLWTAFDDKMRAAIEALKQTYEKEIKLDAAVTYWDTKAAEHRESFQFYLCAFVITLIVSLAVALEWLPNQVADRVDTLNMVANSLQEIHTFEFLTMSLSIVALAGLPFLLIVWVLRFLMREVIEQSRLREDATMRARMVHVYLALIRDVGDVSKTNAWNQDIIMNAIFRPVAVSTSDDGWPGGEIIKVLKGR